jgi:hypothetical protein
VSAPANDNFANATILNPAAGSHSLAGLTTRDATFQVGEPVLSIAGTPPIQNQSVWFKLIPTDGILKWRVNNLACDGNVCTENHLLYGIGKGITTLADATNVNMQVGTWPTGASNPYRSIPVRSGEVWTWAVESYKSAAGNYGFNDQTYFFDFDTIFTSYPWQPIAEGGNTLYAALAGGDVSVSDLYTIDLDTGQQTSLGSLGLAVTGLSIHPGTGDMYGVTGNSFSPLRRLIRIDNYLTGPPSVTNIGSLGSTALGDIAFRSDGVLFGWSGNGKLWTVNLATGAATQVGSSTLSGAFGASIDFVGSTLYGLVHGDNGNVYTINQATGVATPGAALSGAPFAFDDCPFAAGAVSPNEQKFYAIDNDYGTGAALVTVDRSTGVVDTTGILFDNAVDAICWYTGDPVVTEAPTSVNTTTAIFHAEVNPQGVSSDAYFEYGLTLAYGETTPTQAIGSGVQQVAVQQLVTGLRPGRTYHVRAVRNP